MNILIETSSNFSVALHMSVFADSLPHNEIVDSEEERREFEGIVTHVFSTNGLVDNEVYFSFEQVQGDNPKVNDKVHVRAVRHHSQGGWHAEQVVIEANWEETDGSDLEDDVWRPGELVGMVTHSSIECPEGYVNDDLYYNLEDCCHGDFIPHKGDWVKVSISYDGEDRLERKVTAIQPLRVMDTEGVVSGAMGDHGYIDGEVFYTTTALQNGFIPKKWEAVHYR